jgi:type II secretory pathway predicted ATPase ExeA
LSVRHEDSVMDLTRYGLVRRPFRTTPDTALICPIESHDASVAVLCRAAADSGVGLLDGEPGVGKTVAVLRVLEALSADTLRVLVNCSPAATPADFFQAVLFDLGKPFVGLREQELRLTVHEAILAALDSGRPVVVFVDEAHHLTAEACEELRLLGNLGVQRTVPAFVLLAGLPDMRARLGALAQRIAVRCRLEPMTRDETVRYVRHQVRECGGRPDVLFTDEALALVADHAGGLPRVVNRVAGRALELAADAGHESVDAEPVYDALVQLDLIPAEQGDAVLLPIRPDVTAGEAVPSATPPPGAQLPRRSRTTQQTTPRKGKRKSA